MSRYIAPIPNEGHWDRLRLQIPPAEMRMAQQAADRASMRLPAWVRRAIRRALDAEKAEASQSR